MGVWGRSYTSRAAGGYEVPLSSMVCLVNCKKTLKILLPYQCHEMRLKMASLEGTRAPPKTEIMFFLLYLIFKSSYQFFPTPQNENLI